MKSPIDYFLPGFAEMFSPQRSQFAADQDKATAGLQAEFNRMLANIEPPKDYQGPERRSFRAKRKDES